MTQPIFDDYVSAVHAMTAQLPFQVRLQCPLPRDVLSRACVKHSDFRCFHWCVAQFGEPMRVDSDNLYIRPGTWAVIETRIDDDLLRIYAFKEASAAILFKLLWEG